MVEHNTQEKREDLGNAKEVLEKFEGRIKVEVRRQEKIDMMEERNFRRGELPEKFMARMLYRQDNEKFKEEYLRKLEKNWKKIKE